ncbi:MULTISPECIES: replication initiation factor domain-containing protein [Xanthomonas]|uniref:replication initiation factor domain-containing protein n=1 Tax=Xanthomonas TaxID=338 RepID=UPI00052C7DE5|nr:replication initiation factor domain-containing protein [Xanthomonas citri]MBV6778851.1 replication initiation factor domain-containing protein [Xanthomonas campestris pv. carissae]CEH64640.1 Phage replication protein [Xanthomonas citri pv. citri]
MTALVAFAGSFSPVRAGEKVGGREIGPTSNTGQKGQETGIIDYLTLVMPETALEDFRCTNIDLLLFRIFGFRGEVVATALRNKNWMFYSHSALLMDREGELVGRIGMGGNKSTVCVSLSGAGCKWVKDWAHVQRQAAILRARISRVDCAHDDYEGERLDVHALRKRAADGEFCQGGCPPRHRFLSDEGHGTGSTLYVGAKGHKELCIYEKGKQMGLKTSRWVRAEVRLYGKHVEIPLDVLTDPGAYLRGSYDVLRELITGICTRLRTIRKQVDVSVEAGIEWAHRQVGPFLNVLRGAFGHSWSDVCEARILREGHPGRFRGISKGEPLHRYVREQLCQSAAS